MKTYKLIPAIVVLCFAAISCQETALNQDMVQKEAKVVLRAFFEDTKVTYQPDGQNLTPSWTIGDVVLGIDSEGEGRSFTVTGIDCSGIAIIEGSAPEGALHLIYAPGCELSDIVEGTLTIDYTKQDGTVNMPAVMLSDGIVEDGGGTFVFRNAGAVIAINNFKTDNANGKSAISGFTVLGSNLSKAVVSVSGGALVMSPVSKSSDSISLQSVVSFDSSTGALAAPVYLAIPAQSVVSGIEARLVNDTHKYQPAAPVSVSASKLICIENQTFSIQKTDNLLPGEFSVSEDRKVRFSKGALYYDGAYKLEESQLAGPKAYIADHISYFFWTNNEAEARAYVYNDPDRSTTDVLFTNAQSGDNCEILPNPGFEVNGVSGKFRSLSNDELDYLLKRTGLSKNNVTVPTSSGGTQTGCLVVFPDSWDSATMINGKTVANKSSYTAEEWALAEAYGAVVFYAFGIHYSNQTAMNDTGNGRYWFSSANPSAVTNASSIKTNTESNRGMFNCDRDRAQTIRLVVDVTDESGLCSASSVGQNYNDITGVSLQFETTTE